MLTLEDELDGVFAELGVSRENQESIMNYLKILKTKDEETYEHSIRVGLLGTRVARYMHLEPKALLFAGTLHDVGKSLIDREILKKTEPFTEKNMEAMEKHAEYTYNLLKDVHEFSAEVALRHHRYQENEYPKRLPKSKKQFSLSTKVMIDFFARILSLVDFYDAITYRSNDKYSKNGKLTKEEAKSILLMKNPDQRKLIEEFYTNGIFGEQKENGDKILLVDDHLYDSIWKGWNGKRNPKETRRFITLACALEPLSDKIGCTTRTTDISRHLKLEYFITGAINIGDAFEDLSKKVLEKGHQPPLIYDLAYQAQADCKKNREGGRINQGIIEMLVPIVTAQMIFDFEYKLSAEEILIKAKGVMQNTSPEDVQELIKMKKLAYELCEYKDREVPQYGEVTNVYDYYLKDLQNSKRPISIKHNEEFVLGFPTIKKIYNIIIDSNKRGFNRKVEEAYAQIRKSEHSEVSVGLTADCTAVGIYLILSHHPRDKIIR